MFWVVGLHLDVRLHGKKSARLDRDTFWPGQFGDRGSLSLSAAAWEWFGGLPSSPGKLEWAPSEILLLQKMSLLLARRKACLPLQQGLQFFYAPTERSCSETHPFPSHGKLWRESSSVFQLPAMNWATRQLARLPRTACVDQPRAFGLCRSRTLSCSLLLPGVYQDHDGRLSA